MKKKRRMLEAEKIKREMAGFGKNKEEYGKVREKKRKMPRMLREPVEELFRFRGDGWVHMGCIPLECVILVLDALETLCPKVEQCRRIGDACETCTLDVAATNADSDMHKHVLRTLSH